MGEQLQKAYELSYHKNMNNIVSEPNHVLCDEFITDEIIKYSFALLHQNEICIRAMLALDR